MKLYSTILLSFIAIICFGQYTGGFADGYNLVSLNNSSNDYTGGSGDGF